MSSTTGAREWSEADLKRARQAMNDAPCQLERQEDGTWVDVGMRAALLSLSPPPFKEEAIRKAASAIALKHGLDPDEDAPPGYICGPNNEPLPWWQYYEEDARAVLSVFSDLSRPGRDWLPIESAPRDGTQVLLFVPETTPAFQGIMIEIAAWRNRPCPRGEDYGGAWFIRHNIELKRTPTDWQPLPSPPVSK